MLTRGSPAPDPVVAAPGTCPMGATAVGWAEARTALAQAAEQVPPLLAQVTDPTRRAVGRWSIAEVAAHMSHGWAAMPNLAARDVAAMKDQLPHPPGISFGTPGGAMIPDLGHLATATVAAVAADPERDLTVLGERIREGARRFCTEFDGDSDPTFRPWIAEPITAPPAMFACHLLLETLMHSHDIATAARIGYEPISAHADVAIRGFILPMLVNVTRGQPGPRLAIDLRLAGSHHVTMAYTGAGVALEPPRTRPVDAHLWIRPWPLLLLMWHRRTLAATIARADVFVWGRRPWAALEPLRAVPDV